MTVWIILGMYVVLALGVARFCHVNALWEGATQFPDASRSDGSPQEAVGERA